jgi:hypothetical protein
MIRVLDLRDQMCGCSIFLHVRFFPRRGQLQGKKRGENLRNHAFPFADVGGTIVAPKVTATGTKGFNSIHPEHSSSEFCT